MPASPDSEAMQAAANPKAPARARRGTFAVERGGRPVGPGSRCRLPPGSRGWDRTAPAWPFVNPFPIDDIPRRSQFNAAAGVAKRTGVSVADAHLGAAIQATEGDQVPVLTSDPGDMRKVAEGRQVTIVAL